MAGKLYLCATPIGNLEDITLRVINTLKSVDLIAAEDTRNSIKLLSHYEIKTPMTSYHEHNRYDKARYLVHEMENGKDIALISDAGTPGISDPGEVLVRLCYKEGIEVTALPGACASVTALALSGMSAGRFSFEAFLPREKKERAAVLGDMTDDTRTLVVYEAPHHLIGTLNDLLDALGERRIAVCRELTKRYETVLRTTISGAIAHYEQEEPRGEFVLVIEGRSREELKRKAQEDWTALTLEEHMEYYTSAGMDRMEAMKQVAKDRGVKKSDIYRELIPKSRET